MLKMQSVTAFRRIVTAGFQKEESNRVKLELKMSPLLTLTSLHHHRPSGKDVLLDSL